MTRVINNVTKEKNFILFSCEDEEIIRYDLNAKAFIGKRGTPIKSGYSFDWRKYREALTAIYENATTFEKMLLRAMGYYNDGATNSVIEIITKTEGYFSANLTHLLSATITYDFIPLDKVNKDFLKYAMKNNVVITRKSQEEFLINKKINDYFSNLYFTTEGDKNIFFRQMIDANLDNKAIEYLYTLYYFKHFQSIITVRTLIVHYKDYLNKINYMNSQSKKNNFPKYPKDFLIEYDRAIVFYEDYKNKELDDKIKRHQSKLPLFETEDYIVKIPMSVEELREEGERQKNCVGSYSNSVASENNFVIFIRKKTKASQSFMTLSYYKIRDKTDYAFDQIKLAMNEEVDFLEYPQAQEITNFYSSIMKSISAN